MASTEWAVMHAIRGVFEQLTVLAPGLLGASLAQAVRERRMTQRIHVWARRPETRVKCERESWCDAVFSTPEAACEGSDLVVLCTPVETLHLLAEQIAGALSEGAIVTDVGSTKSLVCRRCHAAMPKHAFFVGSHPMAGSEKSGMDHAEADLFQGRSCFVTPLTDSNERAVEQVVRFWTSLGMRVVTMTPEKHDEIVAHISHLPHVLASLLSAQLRKRPSDWKSYAGGGLRDTTRVAAGSPQLWKEIISQNREEILRAVEEFEQELRAFQSALANEDYVAVLDMLAQGKDFRDSLTV